jgi:site-specific recombinase XerC
VHGTSPDHPRDRVLTLLPFCAGLRIAETVGLDVNDIALSARKGTLRVHGKAPKLREVPVAFQNVYRSKIPVQVCDLRFGDQIRPPAGCGWL